MTSLLTGLSNQFKPSIVFDRSKFDRTKFDYIYVHLDNVHIYIYYLPHLIFYINFTDDGQFSTLVEQFSGGSYDNLVPDF
jgi:hypothetical protein